MRGLILSGLLLYLLPAWLGLDGVWWAMVLTEGIVAAVTLACVFVTNRTLQHRLL